MDKKKSTKIYKPKNPRDPKIPNLKSDWEPAYFEEEKISPDTLTNKVNTPKSKEKKSQLKDKNDLRLVTAAFDSFILPVDNLKYKKNRDFVEKINTDLIDASIDKKNKFAISGETINDFVELTFDEKKQLESRSKKQLKKDNEFKKLSLYDEAWDTTDEGSLIPALKNGANKNILNMLSSIRENEEGKVEKYKEGFEENIVNLDKRKVNENGYIIPDPSSTSKITTYREFYNRSVNSSPQSFLNRSLSHGRPGAASLGSAKSESRRTLTKKEIEFLISKFGTKVIKITKYEVILKHLKYGYEIYFNINDNRWWVVALVFNEPYDCSTLKAIKFTTLWSGSSFIGYGMNSLEEVYEKTELLFKTGRTGNIVIREYLYDYNIKTKRIYVYDEPKVLTYEEYKTFSSWFRKNRIDIFLKTYGKQDAEDLEQINYENKKKGIQDARAVLGMKFAIMPRKSNYIFAYPVPNPKKSKSDLWKPENKFYQIAFGVTD
ncbi:hypothetical protein [Spiroplasma endosymbiont of Aspidapion aeneum]|uniref:hypothetical protein n=1 Tax=Spiroplasma endosymbiont of Aspidapion aeneum TaxID=3066276 RepID=UPI00313C1DF5